MMLIMPSLMHTWPGFTLEEHFPTWRLWNLTMANENVIDPSHPPSLLQARSPVLHGSCTIERSRIGKLTCLSYRAGASTPSNFSEFL